MARPRLPDDVLSRNTASQRKYREDPDNRLKAVIRNRIHYAVKMGRLVRLPCQVCGTPNRVEAHHHNGYDLEHALDVVWLCKSHHEALHHKKEKAA